MNIHLKSLVSCLASTVAVTLLFSIATPAYAQRDAGAKARGEFGTGGWNSNSQPRSYSPIPVETRRSFSYQPTAAVAGCQCGASQAATSEHVATQPQVERRSFSYEPSYRSYRSYSSPKKEPWQYPKTDPRRYQP
jgi:hypothetical protein